MIFGPYFVKGFKFGLFVASAFLVARFLATGSF